MQRDLVERAMSGDHDAFSELARVSVGRLLVIARLILHDEPAAEDATQEALVAAWRHIRGLRDPERFEAWLHRLLVNACHREARGRRSPDPVARSSCPPSTRPTGIPGGSWTATSSIAGSAASTSTIGSSSSSTTTSVSVRMRPPMSSACRPERSGRGSIAPCNRCEPLSRRTHEPNLSGEGRTA